MLVGGDVVERVVGAEALATGCRVRRVVRWFTGRPADERFENKGNDDFQAAAGQFASWIE